MKRFVGLFLLRVVHWIDPKGATTSYGCYRRGGRRIWRRGGDHSYACPLVKETASEGVAPVSHRKGCPNGGRRACEELQSR